MARPFGQQEFGAASDIVEAAVVGVEARRQAEARVEREGADERAGAEAVVLQPGGERLDAWRQSIAAVLAVAMLKRVQTGKDAGVRGQRDDGLSVGERETDAAGGDGIDVRRARRAAVAAERVAAQRIDGDEEDVAVRCLNKVETIRGASRGQESDKNDGKRREYPIT